MSVQLHPSESTCEFKVPNACKLHASWMQTECKLLSITLFLPIYCRCMHASSMFEAYKSIGVPSILHYCCALINAVWKSMLYRFAETATVFVRTCSTCYTFCCSMDLFQYLICWIALYPYVYFLLPHLCPGLGHTVQGTQNLQFSYFILNTLKLHHTCIITYVLDLIKEKIFPRWWSPWILWRGLPHLLSTSGLYFLRLPWMIILWSCGSRWSGDHLIKIFLKASLVHATFY